MGGTCLAAYRQCERYCTYMAEPTNYTDEHRKAKRMMDSRRKALTVKILLYRGRQEVCLQINPCKTIPVAYGANVSSARTSVRRALQHT